MPETYTADAEIFSDDTLQDIDLAIGDIEDELEAKGSSEFSDDFDGEDSEDLSEDELEAYYRGCNRDSYDRDGLRNRDMNRVRREFGSRRG